MPCYGSFIRHHNGAQAPTRNNKVLTRANLILSPHHSNHRGFDDSTENSIMSPCLPFSLCNFLPVVLSSSL
ncbi:hypothetical protein C8R42DRAFT_656071 [Lentinula raphanica]|nr:hypothetical protein C8R42DRAFT_656071 [Lentinula raphanica]